MKLQEYLKSLGYNIDDTEVMQPYIKQWQEWYKGDVPKFQRYYIYNGNKKNWFTRKTLNLPKKISEEFANLLMNEHVEIMVGNRTNTKALNELLEKINFYEICNKAIEKGFSLGTSALVVGIQDLKYDGETITIDEDSEITMQCVEASKIIPLSYNSEEITECAFATNKTIGGQKFLYLQIHRFATDEDRIETPSLTLGNYIIENHMFKVDKSGALSDISDKFDDTLKIFDTGSNKPWFAIIKPNIINNLNENSPYGISVYANSLDIIKGLDITYDSLVNEFLLGRKRIFVKSDLMQPDLTTGELKFTFDVNESVFHQLPMGASQESGIIDSESALRVQEHENGIQLGLNLLSSNLGMGTSHYTFDRGSVQTATQIISENNDLYKTIVKHEILLDKAIKQIVNALLYISGLQGKNIEGDITINFDDSIIQDTDAKKEQAYKEYNNGLIDKAEYFVETRNMTRKQAEAFIKTMQKPLSELQAGENLGVIDKLELRQFFYPGENETTAKAKIDQIRAENPTTSELLGE